jgi:hypothetical protein
MKKILLIFSLIIIITIAGCVQNSKESISNEVLTEDMFKDLSVRWQYKTGVQQLTWEEQCWYCQRYQNGSYRYNECELRPKIELTFDFFEKEIKTIYCQYKYRNKIYPEEGTYIYQGSYHGERAKLYHYIYYNEPLFLVNETTQITVCCGFSEANEACKETTLETVC